MTMSVMTMPAFLEKKAHCPIDDDDEDDNASDDDVSFPRKESTMAYCSQ